MKYFKEFTLPESPVFPPLCLNVTDFGAAEGDLTKNKAAIKAAIDECAILGGGTVIIPRGVWKCGAIRLKSNVALYLEEGCVLDFSINYEDYLPPVFMYRGGMKLYGPSPFIYALGEKNVALCGSGTVEGNGARWWGMAQACPSMNDLRLANRERRPLDKRVYADEKGGMRPPLVHFVNCDGVLVEGVTLKNSPSWTLHPMACKDVTVRNVKIFNPQKTPNTDGIDVESCRNVLIEDCEINTCDDVICIKSGRNEDAWDGALPPTENILVRNCRCENGAGGATLGSELSAGARNILFESCRFTGAKFGIRIKSCRVRGGTVENVAFKNIELSDSVTAGAEITVTAYANSFEDSLFPSDNSDPEVRLPTVRNIEFENVKSSGSPIGIRLLGMKENRLSKIDFRNCEFASDEALIAEYTDTVNMESVTFGG